MKKINVKSKSSQLVLVLKEHFGGKINQSRIKLMSLFIISLCKVQTVNFERLACGFETGVAPASSLRRIQRFIANFELNKDLIARFIFALLPVKEKLCLSIDRSNWKFGNFDINIFMLGVCYKGLAFPLLFTMLPKRGNSNTAERIKLIERFINLFGKQCIDALMADREFVGDEWIKYLNDNKIRYYIRIRNNFKVYIPRKGEEIKVSWLFNPLGLNEYYCYPHIVRIGKQLCYLSGQKIVEKGKGVSFLIIISFNEPNKANKYYAKRWQIETCFKAMKTSGFNIEKTHLKGIERVEKLLLLVMIAYIWCYKVGIHLDQNIKKIKRKKHGRNAKSLMRYGLDYICLILLNQTYRKDNIGIVNFLSCT